MNSTEDYYLEDYYLYETIRSSYDKDFKKLIETIKEMK